MPISAVNKSIVIGGGGSETLNDLNSMITLINSAEIYVNVSALLKYAMQVVSCPLDANVSSSGIILWFRIGYRFAGTFHVSHDDSLCSRSHNSTKLLRSYFLNKIALTHSLAKNR